MSLLNIILIVVAFFVFVALANFAMFLHGIRKEARLVILMAFALIALVAISPKLGLMPWLWR